MCRMMGLVYLQMLVTMYLFDIISIEDLILSSSQLLEIFLNFLIICEKKKWPSYPVLKFLNVLNSMVWACSYMAPFSVVYISCSPALRVIGLLGRPLGLQLQSVGI